MDIPIPTGGSRRKGKGLPKRVGRANYKARYAAYLQRATCFSCRTVFFSPKKRIAHDLSKHESLVGLNVRRLPK